MSFSFGKGLQLAGNALASVGKMAANHISDKLGASKFIGGISSGINNFSSGTFSSAPSRATGQDNSATTLLKNIYDVVFSIFYATQQNGKISMLNNATLEENRGISAKLLSVTGEVAKNTATVSDEIKKQNEKDANKTDLFGIGNQNGSGVGNGVGGNGDPSGLGSVVSQLGAAVTALGFLLGLDAHKDKLKHGYKAASLDSPANVKLRNKARKEAALAVEDPSETNIIDQIDDGSKTAEEANKEARDDLIIDPLEEAAGHVAFQVGKGAVKGVAANARGGNAVTKTINTALHPVETAKNGLAGAKDAAKGLNAAGVAGSVITGEVGGAATSGMLEGFGVDPRAAGLAGDVSGAALSVMKFNPATAAIAGTMAFASSMMWGSAALGMHDDTQVAADQDKQNLMPEEQALYDKFIRPNIDRLMADGDEDGANEMYHRWKQALQQIRVMVAVENPAPTPWRAADVLKPEEAKNRSWTARQLDIRPQAIEQKLDRLGLWDTTQFFKERKEYRENLKKDQERAARVENRKSEAKHRIENSTIDQKTLQRGKQLKKEYDYMQYARNSILGLDNQVAYLQSKGFSDEQIKHFKEMATSSDQFAHFYSEDDEVALHAYEEYEKAKSATGQDLMRERNLAKISVEGFIQKMTKNGFQTTGDTQKDSLALKELFRPYFAEAQKTNDPNLTQTLTELYEFLQETYGLSEESAQKEKDRLRQEQAAREKLEQEAKEKANMQEIADAEAAGLAYHVYEEEYGYQTGKILHFATLKEKNDYLRSHDREYDIGEIEPEARSQQPSEDSTFVSPASDMWVDEDKWGYVESDNVQKFLDDNDEAKTYYENMLEFYRNRGNSEWDAQEKAERKVRDRYMSTDEEQNQEDQSTSSDFWSTENSSSEEDSEALNATAEATINSEQTLRRMDKSLAALVEMAQPKNQQNAVGVVLDGGNIT